MAEETKEAKGPEIVVLKFADSKVPEFKEVRNKSYIPYGEQNDYGEYLTYLYNKSAKHNAIINGKCNYILGNGFVSSSGANFGKVNRTGETLNELFSKLVKDREIYGGYKIVVIRDSIGRVSELWHYDFFSILPGKDDGLYYYKENWKDNREKERPLPEFNINAKDPISVYAFNEYRPGSNTYPLPGYIGANNYIETDIEISKFHLSAIRNGMMPSKMIQFFNGEPTPEAKTQIEKSLKNKYVGSEKAGQFVLVFNQDKNKSVEVTDLSASELDKQFDLLNKTCQQEIFTGHQVVSPMLFGIKTEGQLGGTTELKMAYEIFINTYAKPKQYDLEKDANFFGALMGRGSDYYIEQVDPIGLQLNVAEFKDILPKEYFFEKLNIPKEFWTPSVEQPGETLSKDSASVNENLKKLSGREYGNMMRIVREFGKGKLTREAAAMMLATGYGLTEADIETLLGKDESQEFSAQDEDTIVGLFSECGEPKENFHIVKSKKVKFESDQEAFDDEIGFYSKAQFKTIADASKDAEILDLINKDELITPEVIAEAIGVTPEFVVKRIVSLLKGGYIETETVKVGDDEQIKRKVVKPIDDIRITKGEPETTQILIKYSYEGPQDDRNRAFCAKMLKLNKLYSRTEIEKISEKLGYSVFDRRGGFWNKGNGVVSPSCRHHFQSHIVVKKGDK